MKSQLKVLLAGFGDIARRLVTHPDSEGLEFTAVRRRPIEDEAVLDIVNGDLADSRFVSGLLKRPFDVVVASITPDHFSDAGYRDSYVAVAQSFARALEAGAHKPGLIIWVSSTSVYGNCDGGWVSEETVAAPTSFSGKRLLEAEQLIQQLPVKSVIVRFSGIYGPGRTRTIESVKSGIVAPEAQPAWSNRIHSDDCAGVLAHLIRLFGQGDPLHDMYVGSDMLPVPLHEVHRWIAGQLGITELSEKPSAGRANRRCCNKRLLASGYTFKYPDYRSGYQPLLERG